VAIASLGMMRNLVSNGVDRVFELAYQASENAALEVVVNAKIASILAEPDVDPKVGLSKEELGKRSGIEPKKLGKPQGCYVFERPPSLTFLCAARVIRLLAAQRAFAWTEHVPLIVT
jgi:hypothetical protein